MVVIGVIKGKQLTFGLGKSAKGIVEHTNDIAAFGLHGSQLVVGIMLEDGFAEGQEGMKRESGGL
jgi:hypothetical protein